MIKSLLRAALALALPAAGLLAPPSAAEANVRSTVGGAACQWMMGNFRASDITFYSDGSTVMSPGDPLAAFALTCPVQRALPLSTDGYSDLEVRFRPTSALPAGIEVWCTATTYRSDGSVASAKSMTIPIPATVGSARPVTVMDFANGLNATGSKGMTAVQCLLPMTVQLVSLYSSEVDGIDSN